MILLGIGQLAIGITTWVAVVQLWGWATGIALFATGVSMNVIAKAMKS